jgi:serine phosphatase RsbU (regulator of sigma subunit)
LQRKEAQFEEKTLALPFGTTVYLSTDGFVDQNDHERKSFGLKTFWQLLQETSRLPWGNQKKNLEQVLKKTPRTRRTTR